jgi:hypothetical protein
MGKLLPFLLKIDLIKVSTEENDSPSSLQFTGAFWQRCQAVPRCHFGEVPLVII